MSGIVLHQYAESPFSEKVRAILGYKGVSYQAVEIPMIMPIQFHLPVVTGKPRSCRLAPMSTATRQLFAE